MKTFDLNANNDPQTYGIGVKELWEVKPEHFKKGLAIHTLGWPLQSDTYGGAAIYFFGENLMAYSFVVGLDYTNPLSLAVSGDAALQDPSGDQAVF